MARDTAAPRAAGSWKEVFGDPSVRVAVGLTVVIMLGYGLIVPVLPLFARSFGVGRTEVGLLLTTFALTRLAFDLVAGPLVDRFGQRWVATAGLLLVGATSGASAWSPSFAWLLSLRALGGAGSSVLFAAIMSFLLHRVPAARMGRTMSAFYASFLLGTLLGQPLGGLIGHYLGLAAPLVFYAGFCFFSASLAFRHLREQERPRGEVAVAAVPQEGLAEVEAPLPSRWGGVKGLLSGRAFVTALVANAVIFWVMGSVRLTLVPLFAKEEVGLSEVGIGAVLGAAALAQFTLMWKAGTLTDARGRRAVLVPAAAALAAAVALVGWATSGVSLALVMAAVGVATAFAGVVPAAVVADVAPRPSSGTAVGLYRFAGDVGLVVGPAVGGVVADAAGFRPAFVAVAIPLAIVFVLAVRMPETLRRE